MSFAPELASLNMGSINFGLCPLLNKYKTFQHEWEPNHLESTRDLVCQCRVNFPQKCRSKIPQLCRRGLAHSRVVRTDGQRRETVHYDGGVVPPGAVFLHSEFPGAFDSRYFGPLPMDGILELAHAVWTYAP